MPHTVWTKVIWETVEHVRSLEESQIQVLQIGEFWESLGESGEADIANRATSEAKADQMLASGYKSTSEDLSTLVAERVAAHVQRFQIPALLEILGDTADALGCDTVDVEIQMLHPGIMHHTDLKQLNASLIEKSTIRQVESRQGTIDTQHLGEMHVALRQNRVPLQPHCQNLGVCLHRLGNDLDVIRTKLISTEIPCGDLTVGVANKFCNLPGAFTSSNIVSQQQSLNTFAQP